MGYRADALRTGPFAGHDGIPRHSGLRTRSPVEGRGPARQPRHPGRADSSGRATVPRRVPVGPACHRDAARAVVAGTARRRPARTPEAQRARLPEDLDPEGSPLHGRVAQARERARRAPARQPRRPRAGRTRDDLRQPVDSRRAASACAGADVQRLLVLPMYPQYSATTTAAIFERVTARALALALDTGTAHRQPVLGR